jgi:hypothetical protein
MLAVRIVQLVTSVEVWGELLQLRARLDTIKVLQFSPLVMRAMRALMMTVEVKLKLLPLARTVQQANLQQLGPLCVRFVRRRITHLQLLLRHVRNARLGISNLDSGRLIV